jgi:acetyltransferase-like isoleucine patch superfamily enzyme
MSAGRTLPDDWYPGTIPDNVTIDPGAYVGSSYNFARFGSVRPDGMTIGRGASLDANVLDVGPRGAIVIGEFAMVTQAYILCDFEIEIGAYSFIAWYAVLMDNYRTGSANPVARRSVPGCSSRTGPIRLGRNSWIGFEACILPGITIGEGSVVGARSVVGEDVPPYVVVAGNPARVVRDLPRDGSSERFDPGVPGRPA